MKLCSEKDRARGLHELRKLPHIDASVTEALRAELSSPSYTTRSSGWRLAEAKALLDEYAVGNAYSPVNPDRTLKHIERMKSHAPEFFEKTFLGGAKVIDYGAGVYSTFNQAIILIANGVKRVVCVEPGLIRKDVVKASALQVLQSIHVDPERFNLVGLSPSALARNIESLDFSKLDDEDDFGVGGIDFVSEISQIDQSESFDLIVSTSVLEHVVELDAEVSRQYRLLGKGGAALHVVDFTDHRHSAENYHPFLFYFDGFLKDCSGLRVSEIEQVFVENGFEIARRDERKFPGQLDRAEIIDRFSGMSEDDLRTEMAVLAAEKPGRRVARVRKLLPWMK